MMAVRTDHDSGRVLIVDDEPDFVANLTDILNDVGFEAEGTSDPYEALRWAESRDYDAAVLDLRMPGLDGLGLHDRLRRARFDMPTILLTAFADSETHRRASAAGFWQILEKPCRIPTIRSILRRLTRAPLLLVVDDDAEFCTNLLQILHQRRIRAVGCATVAEAIERWDRRPADLLLVDLKLPGESATDLIRHARRSDPDVEVRIVTGASLADESERRALHEMGVDAIWSKPLDIEELLATIPAIRETKQGADDC
ncbi:MAG TPA: hypothetical protein DCQ98_04940 [Planctomycetaceae bacterium]|nr:hypothetical protein [Planctomycetaceae bacterium]